MGSAELCGLWKWGHMGREAHFPSLRPFVSPRSSSLYLVSGVAGPGVGQLAGAGGGPAHPITARTMSGCSLWWELDPDGMGQPGHLCTKGC